MGRDTLSIDIQKPEQGCESAIIKINGRELLEIVKEIELSVSQATDEISLAGSYWYLPRHLIQAPSQLLTGGNIPSYLEKKDGKRAILDCTCGSSGCWPLIAKITRDGESVKWSEFEQPHREDWVYPSSFEFNFSRFQLEEALKREGLTLHP